MAMMMLHSLLIGFILMHQQGGFGVSAVMVDVIPRENTVLPKQNVTFLCRVGVPLQYCRVEIPGMSTLNLNHKLPPVNGVAYNGAGLSAGQCGFSIASVDESNNGKVKCYLGIENEAQEASATMQLTIARRPKSPELDLSRGTDSLRVYKMHDQLHASCIVRDGRPVANISWYLDDEPLQDGLSMPTIIDFAKEDLHSKVQNLTRILLPSDNGKLLRCVASHPALPEPTYTSRQLDVKYPPLPLGNPIDKFGYEIGKPGIISVEIDANPKPQLEWSIRDQRIREGAVDTTGRIEAEAAQDRGRGHYVANLRIAAITKQDTETQYILTAYNDMGTHDYTILISTSPEPEGVEFGANAILGLVISILILGVAIFLVVFSWRTGRWCFSAFPPPATPTPHDTDAESVEQPNKEKRNLLEPLKSKINLKMFRRRGGSDKETRDSTDGMVLNDETKIPLDDVDGNNKQEATGGNKDATATGGGGIVYAELDLVSPQLRPVLKSDDDKTEYAEIVYTAAENEQQKQKQQQNNDNNLVAGDNNKKK